MNPVQPVLTGCWFILTPVDVWVETCSCFTPEKQRSPQTAVLPAQTHHSHNICKLMDGWSTGSSSCSSQKHQSASVTVPLEASKQACNSNHWRRTLEGNTVTECCHVIILIGADAPQEVSWCWSSRTNEGQHRPPLDQSARNHSLLSPTKQHLKLASNQVEKNVFTLLSWRQSFPSHAYPHTDAY